MAIIFPNPAGQTPANTFSPTSTPNATTNGLTYIWDGTLGVWTSTAGGGGGGGVASIAVTAPITDTGTATAPVIGISAATNAAPGSVQLATSAEAAAGTSTTKVLTPSDGTPKVLADMTGAAIIPGGDDAERAAITTPTVGMLRYNDQGGIPVDMEYYDGAAWTPFVTGGGGWTLLSQVTANNAAAVAFTSKITNAYDWYVITGSAVQPSTDAQQLAAQFSTDGGVTYQTTGYTNVDFNNNSSSYIGSFINLSQPTGNAAGRYTHFFLYIASPANASSRNNFYFTTLTDNHTGGSQPSQQATGTNNVGALNAIKFYFPVGNVATGTFRLYGISNS